MRRAWSGIVEPQPDFSPASGLCQILLLRAVLLLAALLLAALLLTALPVVGALSVALRNSIVTRRSAAAVAQDTRATCSTLAWLHLLGSRESG
jgi:hypothetical protein